jgi:8-oxoguanine deaminase
MVAGTWRVEDGQPAGVDVEKLRREHGAAAKAFLSAL